MSTLKPLWVLAFFAVAALAGYQVSVFTVDHGFSTLALPTESAVSFLVIAVVLVVFGLMVRRGRRRGESQTPARRRLHPLQAVRVVVAAQAAAYAGAILSGYHTGVWIYFLVVIGGGAGSSVHLPVVWVSALMWIVVGFAVEKLCSLPPDETNGGGQNPDASGSVDEGPDSGYAQLETGSETRSRHASAAAL